MPSPKLVLLFLCAAFSASSGFPLSCSLHQYLGCYDDTKRPVSILVAEQDPKLSLDTCALMCAADGYIVFAATSHPGFGYCYCGAELSPNASRVADAQCSGACPGNHSQSCGASGFSSAWRSSCSAPLPAPAVGMEGPPQPSPACSSLPSRAWAFCNASLPIEARLDDLVARIAVTEIGAQLTARQSPAIPRLGMPLFMWGTNVIHGITNYAECRAATGKCPTSWPNGVSLGASWNASAWRAMGAATGVELRAYDNLEWRANAAAGVGPVGGLVAWGPTINVHRDARWGRAQEAFSECPFLTAAAAVAVTQGLQEGEDPRYLLSAATLKHAFAYSLEQWRDPVSNISFQRQTFDALVTPFDLGDTYTPAFKAAISQARAAGIMYAANALNGIPACTDAAADGLLNSWTVPGAPFYRATDGGQIENAFSGHRHYPSLDAALGAAAAAESDIADGSEYSDRLLFALCNGNVSLGAAQKLLKNTLRIRMALGLFDDTRGQKYLSYGDAHIATGATNESVAIAAREGLVLLKNDGATLPFTTSPLQCSATPSATTPVRGLASVAVIGPCADDMVLLGGNYMGPVCPNGPHGPALDCHPSILGAIVQRHAPDALYAAGGGYNDSSPEELAAAVAAVQGAARVVLCLGINKAFEAEQLDREEVGLPPSQLELFSAVERAAAAGARKPLAVVLVHGGPLSIPTIAASSAAGAILDALQPGVVAGGEAVADALWGCFSPGGKLPYTVPFPNITRVSNMTSMAVGVGRTGPLPQGTVGRTYRYSREPPLFPFGFGLSYTNFSLAWAAPQPPAVYTFNAAPSATTLSLAVEVRNTGGAAGGEVVQLFHAPIPGSFGGAEPPFLPLRQLWAFERCRVLQPGEAAVLHFNLTAQQLELTQVGGDKAVLNGDFRISAFRGHGAALEFMVQVRGFGENKG